MDPINGQADASELFQAQSHLYKHLYNFIDSMSLKCAVQLGIPDIIYHHNQPITLPNLATALKIHPSKTGCLHRLMRALVHSGLFAKTKPHGNDQAEEAYTLTPSSKLLLKESATNHSPMVLAFLDPVVQTPWQLLGDWFLGSESTSFEKIYGLGLWDYCQQNPEFGDLGNKAMASDSSLMSLVVKDLKSTFEGLDSLVDVGGGNGTFAKIISEAFPLLKCIVLDLPHVVANLPDTVNLKYIGGDMFHYIPAADAIVLKWILHDWSHEDCLKILKKCKEAILSSKGKEGKVIIIDVVINEKKDDIELTKAKLHFDLLMMVLLNGRERAEEEWAKLFLDAGFSHYKIQATFGLKSLIEVYP